jgi:hypothetical protein
MRVAVVTAHAPFERDPVDLLAERLVGELAGHGHAATVLRFPFTGTRAVLEQVLALRLFVLARLDRVVTLGFPAYHVRHEEKVVWLVERNDGTTLDRHGPLSEHERDAVAASLHRANREALAGASILISASEAVSQTVEADYGLASEVLHPPSPVRATNEPSWNHVIERVTA